ncbi:MAG TPA: polysaccharide deacetylase family protein [Miltoncostaeaceae bacterium]|nr:polysaccharide deacetylase family protein [Miltoncostaeaceae bacterium]
MDGPDPSPATDARRHARRRRVRRRRLVAACVVAALLVVAGAAFAGVVARTGPSVSGGRASAATTTADRPAATAPATTTAPATATAPTPTVPAGARGGDAPTPEEQVAAVEAVRTVGVPLYRTPGNAGKVVALTFDDGPGPYSRTTVETLERYGMRATFFLCGRSVVRYPDDPAVETSVAAMGDHTWNHLELPTLGAARMRDEIARAQRVIQTTSGERVRLFRPPYGARTPQIDRTASELGMITVLWNVESGDSAGAGYAEMLSAIKNGIAPGDIILFHENRGQTQMVVNRLIPWMRANGWRSVSIPELLAMDPPSPAFLRREAGRFR